MAGISHLPAYYFTLTRRRSGYVKVQTYSAARILAWARRSLPPLEWDAMHAWVRTLAGGLLLAVAAAAAALVLSLFVRAGVPRPADGARFVAYVWLVALTVAVPCAAGVTLIWNWPWRRFVSFGILIGATLWLLGPAYRDGVVAAAVGTIVCSAPMAVVGTVLLVRTRRGGRGFKP
jgi:hypothetical protein